MKNLLIMHNVQTIIGGVALALTISGCNGLKSSEEVINVQDQVEPIAYIHNSIISNLLGAETKSSSENLRTDDHARLISIMACDAAAEIGINVTPETIFEFVQNEQVKFFNIYDKEGTMTPLHYIDNLPYEETVKSVIRQCYINDVNNNGTSLENYLYELSRQETKSNYNATPYRYTDMLHFYRSDCMIWDKYYATKGGDGRHVAAVATDVIVGVALSGVTGFWGAVAAAAVSALASEAMENGEMDPDSGTD